MKPANLARFAAVLAAAGLLSGCGGTAAPAVTVTVPQSPAASSATSDTPTPTPTPTPTEVSPTADSPSPDASTPKAVEATFVMPKVTGMVLQDAQDLLQTLDSYVMDQQDARGLGRIQVLDSNWKVCTQKPKSGAHVPISTVVVLAAVKLSEQCP